MKKMSTALVALAMAASIVPASVSAAPAAPERIENAPVAVQASDRVIVKFKAGANANEIAGQHGASVLKTVGKGEFHVLNVPAGKAEQMVEALSKNKNVELAEVDAILTANYTPNDTYYGGYQYHLPKIQANYAWDQTVGTSARTIAIIDTGVDLQHPDLAGKIVAGYDFVNNDSNADDDQGHGTHVAGTAAAITNNGQGVAGVDWNARIMPIKVLNSQGSGYTADIIDGVYWAADRGAHVINMSLGGGSSSSAFQSAINYAWNKGVIIVAAAGNSNTSAKSYPAAYNNVVSVAATDSADRRASFSNYGTWVDVAAPGVDIVATYNGGGYGYMSGTSMASPVVAGLMSLAWSKNTGYSNATVVSRVLNTSDRISGTGSYWYYGRVNAYRAVNGF